MLHALLLPLLLAPLSAQEPPAPATNPHAHGDDFASMFEHRAFDELMKWKERHPWRVGTEVRKFVLRFAEERAKGDSEIDRVWEMKAAFLAEVLADDVHTEWVLTVLRFPVETRAQFDTVRAGLGDVAATISARKDMTDAAIVDEVEGLRPPVAPPWCFETSVEALERAAEAARATGHPKAAVEIARAAQAIAERTKDGEIALWCASFLMRAEQEAGRRAEAGIEAGRLLAAARDVEHLPADLADTLTGVEKWFGPDSSVAVGVESLRAGLAEREGKQDEALALWMSAVRRSEAIHVVSRSAQPTLDSIETSLYGPDPVRRGALLAARMGRSPEAWRLARLATAPLKGFDEAAEEAQRKEVFAAQKLDAMLVLLADHESSLAASFDAQGIRVAVIPSGLERLRELITGVRPSETEEPKPPKVAFDPAPARLLSRVLLEPLGITLRGRIGVYLAPELSALPLGMLVTGVVPDESAPTGPFRPKFLVEDAAIVRETRGGQSWKVDEPTVVAVANRLRDLGEREDAVRAVQIEMIQGQGSLGSGRTHPWYWAGLELGRP